MLSRVGYFVGEGTFSNRGEWTLFSKSNKIMWFLVGEFDPLRACQEDL